LLNIADNSLKYKVKDQASLQITLRNEGKNAELIFQDDGPGVPQDSLIKIFDEFYRTDESRSNRSKGSGLGLAIVAKAAHRMGGSIRAENAENGGLKIILTLPGDKENE
jgi:Osmosensitive K+ channel histidine kinase